MTDRAALLTQAENDLRWCTREPHAVSNALAVLASRGNDRMRFQYGATPGEMADNLKAASNNTGGKGGHADPTLDAVMKRLAGGEDDGTHDETADRIRHAMQLIVESVRELDAWIGQQLDRTHLQPVHDLTSAADALQVCGFHLEAASAHGTHGDWLLADVIAESAAWLRTKVAALTDTATADSLRVPEQKPIVPCKVCGLWRSGEIAGPSGRCQQCESFWGHHRCEATESIVRSWSWGRERLPAGALAEAKAAQRAKGKGAKAS